MKMVESRTLPFVLQLERVKEQITKRKAKRSSKGNLMEPLQSLIVKCHPNSLSNKWDIVDKSMRKRKKQKN